MSSESEQREECGGDCGSCQRCEQDRYQHDREMERQAREAADLEALQSTCSSVSGWHEDWCDTKNCKPKEPQ